MNFIPFFVITLFVAVFLLVLGNSVLLATDSLLSTRWTALVKPTLQSARKLVSPLWILFALVVVFKNAIFPWTHEVVNTTNFRTIYLSTPAFLARGVVYLSLFTLFLKSARTGRSSLGAFALVMILFVGSFACFDWILSLEPHFHSTIFGLQMIFSGTLALYAFALLRLQNAPEEKELIDLNNVELAMIAIWTYLTFMQYLTIWSANLPDEVIYYKTRFVGISGLIPGIVLIGQCLIPIPLLLFKSNKRSLGFTKKLATWTIAMQLLHFLWMMEGVR